MATVPQRVPTWRGPPVGCRLHSLSDGTECLLPGVHLQPQVSTAIPPSLLTSPQALPSVSPYAFPHMSRPIAAMAPSRICLRGGAVHPSDWQQFWHTAGCSCQAAAAWNRPRPVPGSSWSPPTLALLQPQATETLPFVPSTGRDKSYLCNYQPGNVWLGGAEDVEVVLGGNLSVNHQRRYAVCEQEPCLQDTQNKLSLVLVMFHLEFRILCSILHTAGGN